LQLTRQPEHATGGSGRPFLRRRTALKLPLLAPAAAMLTPTAIASADAGRWPAERAHEWYRAQGWMVGANFITSNAVNQFEMWQDDTYDRWRINHELQLARQIGLNTVRVFLHDQLWTADRLGFQRRLAQFVAIAAHRGIKPLFVFFDSCWDPHPAAGPQPAPRPGVHNSRWVQSPGADRLADRGYVSVMREYVVSILHQFRDDDRVLGWDLWNEPDNPAKEYRQTERPDKLDLVEGLLPQVFGWARSVDPTQPLTSGVWDGSWADPATRTPIVRLQLDLSDVITFHSYAEPAEFESRIRELEPLGRPIMCTEYLARSKGSTIEDILPIAKRHNVSAYNWGLVAGKTQTYLPWDSWDRPYSAPPKLWFHDLLQADGTPYRDSEVEAFQKGVAG
jgi:hypothetical protein